MAIAYLDKDELKAIGLDNGQIYDPTYVRDPDGDKAYNYATRRCGYENPTSVADVDYVVKQYWLIEMMGLYFLHDQYRRNVLKFDVEGLKRGQVARSLKEMIDKAEASFATAREANTTAHIFVSADDVFGVVVYGSGLVDDSVGEDYRED
jgi:hypothetical protein